MNSELAQLSNVLPFIMNSNLMEALLSLFQMYLFGSAPQ